MKQEEFLNSFQEALAGKVSEQTIRENVNYYRNYINSQIQKGAAEEDVLRMLGDPRLLAKTIEESNKFAAESKTENSYYEAYGRSGDGGSSQSTSQGDNMWGDTQYRGKATQIPIWLIAVIGIAVVALVLVLAFSVISFFAPFILIVLVVSLFFRLVRSWINR